MGGYLDKDYMESRLLERIEELKDKYKSLVSNRLPDGTLCTYAGAAVNRSRIQKELGTLNLLYKILSYVKLIDIDDEELVDAFDRLVEPRRKKWTT